MNRSTHPVEKEEVMAYLDGEVEPQRAAAVAGHLDDCAECRALAAQLRGVSQQMAAWQIEPAPETLHERLRVALAEPKPEGMSRGVTLKPHRWLPRGWVWGLAGAVAVLASVFVMGVPSLLRSRMAANEASRLSRERVGTLGQLLKDEKSAGGGSVIETSEYAVSRPGAGPMVARTASLTIVAKDFQAARAAVERIVSQHQGYVASLTITAPKDASGTLAATLRIPAAQLGAALAELKALGRVEQEIQAGEDVTKVYTDLMARLNNSRATEKRLVDILGQRPGKVAEVLEVEREIARVRGEIEQMEAERKNMEKRVQFASVQLTLSEEYKAQLQVTPPWTATRLRNALVNGYRRVAEGVFDLLVSPSTMARACFSGC